VTYKPFPSFADWRVDFDPTLTNRYAERLSLAKSQASPEQISKVMDEALRTAAVDTGALEGLYATDRGFTSTVATQAAAWEMQAAEKGDHVKGAIEDAIAAYEMVLDAVTARTLTSVTEAWIRQLHQVMCASQKTYRVYADSLKAWQDHELPLGSYKQMPNSPTLPSGATHDYASPSETLTEMARLIEELRTPAFLAAHPVVQAAYAHYAFVCVHPFADGNGRVARALASVFLYRNPGVPLVVFADQRNDYLDALEAADADDPDPFVEFIKERVLDSVGIIEQKLSVDHGISKSALHYLNGSTNQEPDEEMKLAAERLRNLAIDYLNRHIQSLELPSWVEAAVNRYVSLPELLPTGYVIAGTDTGFDLNGRKSPVTAERLWWPYSLGVAQKANTPELLIITDRSGASLEVWLREVFPTVTTALQLKVDAWAEGTIDTFVCALANTEGRNEVSNRPHPS
jgi:Fic family protein